MTDRGTSAREYSGTLIVLQATPFCNIDCTYCYLTNRTSAERMSLETLRKIATRVFEGRSLAGPFTILWHAGEPLAVPVEYYEAAVTAIAEVNSAPARAVEYGIQTNATLLSDRWIRFFDKYDFSVGVSVDGPAFIHDRNRLTRSGKPTHRQVMKGVALLKGATIPVSAIAVLTDFSLDFPDEIFTFFAEANIQHVGFNIDETEGANVTSSFVQNSESSLERLQAFFSRILELMADHPGVLRVRELENITRRIFSRSRPQNHANVPMRILTFDVNGYYATYCPELLGMHSEDYCDFAFRHVDDGPIEQAVENTLWRALDLEVQRGVEMCERTCDYWRLCGGGAPSNKFSEQGRFDVAETLACRAKVKSVADAVISHLEKSESAST